MQVNYRRVFSSYADVFRSFHSFGVLVVEDLSKRENAHTWFILLIKFIWMRKKEKNPCFWSTGCCMLCNQAVETLKTFEKKDSRVKSVAATNLSFIYFLVKVFLNIKSVFLCGDLIVFSVSVTCLTPSRRKITTKLIDTQILLWTLTATTLLLSSIREIQCLSSRIMKRLQSSSKKLWRMIPPALKAFTTWVILELFMEN